MINLFGTDFVLNGVPLVGSMTIDDRDVILSGLLADGSAFSFDLNSTFTLDEDFFSPYATLTLFSTVLLGDCDLDGAVTFADIPPFIQILTSGGFLAEADVDQDGAVTFSDIGPFIEILIAG